MKNAPSGVDPPSPDLPASLMLLLFFGGQLGASDTNDAATNNPRLQKDHGLVFIGVMVSWLGAWVNNALVGREQLVHDAT